jgi:hypothetical protein
MSRSVPVRVSAWACGAALLAVSGCAQYVAGSQAGSERACIQFGVNALHAHSTVTTVPAACRGLSAAQINQAVARALDTVVAGTHGKAESRNRAATLSPLLAGLISTVPAAAVKPAAEPTLAVKPAAAAGDRETTGIPALAAWAITIGLGTTMVRRWILRLLRHRPSPDRPGAAGRLPSAVILAHAGLALAGLLAWASYLIAGWTGAGWCACAVLLLAISLGVALISLWLPERGPGRHPPVALIAAHGVLAVTTITLVLAALGSG